MVCPMRFVVLAVSIVVAAALLVYALLPGSDVQLMRADAKTDAERAAEQEDRGERETTEASSSRSSRPLWLLLIDFTNGRFLYRQYKRFCPSKPTAATDKLD